jgi:hypothetical protein
LFASFHTSNRCSQLAYISSKSLTEQVLHRDPDPDKIFDAGSRIHISMKSWIRIRIHIEVKKFMSLEAQNEAVEGHRYLQWRRRGSKWRPEGSVDQWSQIGITLMRSIIRISIKVKRWIWIGIRIKVKSWIRIRNTATQNRNPVYRLQKVTSFTGARVHTCLYPHHTIPCQLLPLQT